MAIDVAYGVHPDMKSHTGACLSFGKGMLYSTSSKQKLNARSSTEAELIGIQDILPQVIWTGYLQWLFSLMLVVYQTIIFCVFNVYI